MLTNHRQVCNASGIGCKVQHRKVRAVLSDFKYAAQGRFDRSCANTFKNIFTHTFIFTVFIVVPFSMSVRCVAFGVIIEQ